MYRLFTSDEPGTPQFPVAGAFALLRASDAGVAETIRESGILEDGRDTGWLQDERVISALRYAFEAHDGKRCKIGDEGRLVHEIWGAHRLFNDPVFRVWAAQEGIDPIWGPIGFILHDSIENYRDLAHAADMAFEAGPVLARCAAICGDAAIFNRYIKPGILYMTDACGLSKITRINAQIRKSFDQAGHCIVEPFLQFLRMYDKLSQIRHDAVALANGLLPVAALSKQVAKGEQKSFPRNFPVALANGGAYGREYDTYLNFMKKRLAFIQACDIHNAPAAIGRFFKKTWKSLLDRTPFASRPVLQDTALLFCQRHKHRLG